MTESLKVLGLHHKILGQCRPLVGKHMLSQEIGSNEVVIQSHVVVDDHQTLVLRVPQQIGVAAQTVGVAHPPVKNQHIALQLCRHPLADAEFQPGRVGLLAGTEGRQRTDRLLVFGQFLDQCGVQLNQKEGWQRQAQCLCKMTTDPFTPKAGAVGLLALHVIAMPVRPAAQERNRLALCGGADDFYDRDDRRGLVHVHPLMALLRTWRLRWGLPAGSRLVMRWYRSNKKATRSASFFQDFLPPHRA